MPPTLAGQLVDGRLWVVDSANCHQLVPIGRVGELAIEGPLLARGYLQDPEKTAAALVSDLDWMARFAPARQRRASLTGDLVRCNHGGSLYFIGRKDTQVKVRGFCIELGDVESNIARDPLANAAAVFALSLGACRKRLVGVVALKTENKPQVGDGMTFTDPSRGNVRQVVGEIQENLSKRIQEYMIPTIWFVLDSFPLTRHGKTDRYKVKD